MKRTAPKALATVFETKGVLKTTDVTIPVYGKPGEFLGYARLKDVPVKAYSDRLRSTLRTPRFE